VDNSAYHQPVAEQAKAALRAKLSLGDRKVILYLARLEEEKGGDYLIGAFTHLNLEDAVLVVVGDGSLRETLEALARQQGVQERVRFVGYVPPEETQIYYAIAEVYVLPSVTMPTGKEPWGLTVNEAMNQGVPVVASEAVGAAAGGLVQSGVNGFVVPERDSAALAQALHCILTDVALREAMSQNARQTIAAWDNERMVEGFQHAIDYARKRRSR